MKKITVAIFLILGLAAHADEVLNIREVSVVAAREATDVRSTPKNISVVTSEEIEKSGANNLAEALKLLPEVNVRDYNGTGRMTTLDIRGQGETAGNNVLLLIDGIPHSPIDMSGNDLNSVPAEDIERIEVMPGTGGVMYGDRAIGGVINIITKREKKNGVSAMAKYELGSYETKKTAASLLYKNENFYVGVAVSKDKTEGYRDHSDAEGNFLNLKYGLFLDKNNKVEVNYLNRDDLYEMPNALYADEMKNDRKQAMCNVYNPDWTISRAEEKYAKAKILEKNYNILYKYTGTNNSIENAMNYDTKTLYNTWSATYKSETENYNIRNNLKLNQKIGFNNLTTGIDYQNGKSHVSSEIIEKENIGVFWFDKIDLFGGAFSVNVGQRKEDIKLNFSNSTESKYSKFLKEYGVNYKYSRFGNIYYNYGEGYRVPATDECYSYFTKTVNRNLRPQSNDKYEIGIKNGNDYFVAKVAAYIDKSKNEIFYNPIVGTNQNMPGAAERKGLEMSSEQYIGSSIILRQYVSFNKSKIKEGTFKDKEIPGVEDKKAGAAVTVKYSEKGSAVIRAEYLGNRYAISDFDNSSGRQGSFTKVDFNLTHRILGADINFGVDNIFDVKYYEYFAKDYYGKIGYYPSAERNIRFGIKYSF